MAVILDWGLIQSRAYHGPIQVPFIERAKISGSNVHLAVYTVLFVLALLTAVRAVPYGVTLGVIIAALIVMDRSIFGRVDYSLLLTFAGFFIFIGNTGRIPAFSQMLRQIVSRHEVLASVAASQAISNVPAALLLSGFTEDLSALIIGINLGGLGTLIVPMASLTSYKLKKPGQREHIYCGKHLLSDSFGIHVDFWKMNEEERVEN